jgi:hypothetical protein
MDCDVEPGAIVMVLALRSDGAYTPTDDATLNVEAVMSGVVFDHTLPNRSVAGAPDAVPKP